MSDSPEQTPGEQIVTSKTPAKTLLATMLTAVLTALTLFVTNKLDELTSKTDQLEHRQVQLTDDVDTAQSKVRDVGAQLVLTRAQREAEATRLRAQIAALESGADVADVQREALAAEARQARLDAAEAKARAQAMPKPAPAVPSRPTARPRPSAVASPRPAPVPSPSRPSPPAPKPSPSGLCVLGLCETRP